MGRRFARSCADHFPVRLSRGFYAFGSFSPDARIDPACPAASVVFRYGRHWDREDNAGLDHLETLQRIALSHLLCASPSARSPDRRAPRSAPSAAWSRFSRVTWEMTEIASRAQGITQPGHDPVRVFFVADEMKQSVMHSATGWEKSMILRSSGCPRMPAGSRRSPGMRTTPARPSRWAPATREHNRVIVNVRDSRALVVLPGELVDIASRGEARADVNELSRYRTPRRGTGQRA